MQSAERLGVRVGVGAGVALGIEDYAVRVQGYNL